MWQMVLSNFYCRTPVRCGCNKTLRNTVSLLKKYNLQVLDSNRRPWSCNNASSECVLSMLNWIETRGTCWPLHALYYFSFKKILHTTSCMRPG